MKKHCDDCGERVYNGACTNCHEEIYIEEQYIDLEMPIPKQISEVANRQRKEIKDKLERQEGI